MNEFINSKSMLTPGLAGSLVMMITNAIDVKFGCGAYLPHFVLAFSFLVGGIVFGDQNVKGFPKFGLYLVNSFVIFAMASGTNAIGTTIAEPKSKSADEIKATIPEVIGFNSGGAHENTVRFLTVQTVTTTDTLRIKRNMLKSQISSCSSFIQSIQSDLVSHQKIYNDPKGKFKLLERINNDLLNVHILLKGDTLLKNETAYQQELVDIQHNLSTLQNALVIERKKADEERKFFKSWFN